MNLRTELMVMADGPRVLDPQKVVADAKKGIDYYAENPGFSGIPKVIKYDITALLGKPLIPCEDYLSSPRSAYGPLTRIVESVQDYAKSRGYSTEVVIQPMYRRKEPMF